MVSTTEESLHRQFPTAWERPWHAAVHCSKRIQSASTHILRDSCTLDKRSLHRWRTSLRKWFQTILNGKKKIYWTIPPTVSYSGVWWHCMRMCCILFISFTCIIFCISYFRLCNFRKKGQKMYCLVFWLINQMFHDLKEHHDTLWCDTSWKQNTQMKCTVSTLHTK